MTTTTTTDPRYWTVLLLNAAADALDARGWMRNADRPRTDGPLSVPAALDQALVQYRNHLPGEVDIFDALETLAAFVHATIWTVVDAMHVRDCPACVMCLTHSGGPLSELDHDGACPMGCRLCDKDAGAVDYEWAAEDVISSWEGVMSSTRIVAAVVRAVAEDHRRSIQPPA